MNGYSQCDLYPNISAQVTTTEQTQPEEAEVVHYATTEGGQIMTAKKTYSIFGVVAAIIILLVVFGSVK